MPAVAVDRPRLYARRPDRLCRPRLGVLAGGGAQRGAADRRPVDHPDQPVRNRKISMRSGTLALILLSVTLSACAQVLFKLGVSSVMARGAMTSASMLARMLAFLLSPG